MKKLFCLLLALTLLSALPLGAAAAVPEVSRMRLLFNPWNGVSEEYVPADPVTLYSLSIRASLSAIQLDRQAAHFAKAMFTDMAADGVTDYMVVSGYRAYESQQRLFTNKINQYLGQGYGEQEARVLASSIVAVPGTSEHQSGYAMDISTSKQGGTLTNAIETSPMGQWMRANCADYGYILRYAKDKTEITGIVYEPWHFRFIGAPHAKIITERGICLEEYLALMKDQGRTVPYVDGDGISYSIRYASALPDVDLNESAVAVHAVAAEGYLVTTAQHNPLLTPLRWN